jgi:N-acetylmuramoyl-L-alanine amidase
LALLRPRRLLVILTAACLAGWLFPPAGPAIPPVTPVTAWLAERSIVLDPGHGGYDPGVVGPKGEREEEIALDIALRVRDLLVAAGVEVWLTRTTDEDLVDPEEAVRLGSRKRADLSARLRLVQRVSPDAFISIHVNSFPSARWWGPQTFFDPDGNPENARLAQCIQENLQKTAPASDRQPAAHRGLFLLRNIPFPATTVEVGFISNPAEARRLMTVQHRQTLAWAIFAGIVHFLQ